MFLAIRAWYRQWIAQAFFQGFRKAGSWWRASRACVEAEAPVIKPPSELEAKAMSGYPQGFQDGQASMRGRFAAAIEAQGLMVKQ